jgi:hypothetical protein
LGDSAFEIVPATNIVEAHITLEIGVGFWLVPENKTKTSFFFNIPYLFRRFIVMDYRPLPSIPPTAKAGVSWRADR